MSEGTTIGFDTATALLGVAAVRGGETLHESWVDADEGGRPRHARALLGEIEIAAEAAGGWDEVSLIAVGRGPGTFTGLRIGVATARALAQARSLPLAGVGSLAALAEPAAPNAGGRSLLTVIDAKRGEGFAQFWDPGGASLWGPVVESPDELAERLRASGAPALAIGDGSLRFRDQLERAGAEIPDATSGVHRVSAAAVCRLAAKGESGAPEAIEPDYLRRPDAELWQEQQRHEKDARDVERNDRDR